MAMQRVVVGLRTSSGNVKIPTFSECLVHYFSKNSDSVTVNFSLENGIFILNYAPEGTELLHSPECPVRILSNFNKNYENYINEPFKISNIGVATSVIIESSDSHVLLTKRSFKMRSSPNVWVLPGGHLENNETIFDAASREIKEETGLDISQENSSILGLWENIYPLLLGVGLPKNHTLVVYLHTHLNETHEELTKKLIPNHEEVGSYCWINYLTLHKLFLCNDEGDIEGNQFICNQDQLVRTNLVYNNMFNKWLWRQPQPYSGVNYALRKWIKRKDATCKF